MKRCKTCIGLDFSCNKWGLNEVWTLLYQLWRCHGKSHDNKEINSLFLYLHSWVHLCVQPPFKAVWLVAAARIPNICIITLMKLLSKALKISPLLIFLKKVVLEKMAFHWTYPKQIQTPGLIRFPGHLWLRHYAEIYPGRNHTEPL